MHPVFSERDSRPSRSGYKVRSQLILPAGYESACGPKLPKSRACIRRSSSLLIDVLANPPQYSSRINDHEIAQPPRSVCGRLHSHAILGGQSLSLNVAPPSFDVLDEQMHHEIAGVLLFVEVLQEKVAVASFVLSNLSATAVFRNGC